MDKLKLLALGSMLAATIVAPNVLQADACCKYCGKGYSQGEVTRYSESCSFYCTVTLCSQSVSGSSMNCGGGVYNCTDKYMDNCDSYVPCS